MLVPVDVLVEGDDPYGSTIQGCISLEEWLNTKTWIKWTVMPQLQFWTWSVSLAVHGKEVFDGQDRCGEIDVGREQGFCEFLLLSEARFGMMDSGFTREETGSKLGDVWGLYWAMLIATKDGVSERRAIGQVKKSVKSKAVWREVRLG